ncbi:MAG: NADH-quinone oxidoreductase subunit NuoH [Chloroflexi bacterium]|nr:NADH-quinone oxidoreductase subunit NuoH [Chloroflexota bacterium]
MANIRDRITDWANGLFVGWVVYLLIALVGIVAILIFLVPSLMAFIWIERRLVGRFQVRYGPNRVGPFGILQPVADALKVLAKEALTPADADKWVFWLAPVAIFVPALLVYAVLPFGPRMSFADLNIGILYVVAISSLSAISVFMAGWSSNNKFSLLGAMRAVAQMVSYEVPMVLSILGVIMLAGSLQMSHIVQEQLDRNVWFILIQPLGFMVYFISAVAELNRTPTDIMEAESEIVAGYHTEYSGMKFSLFYLAEYTNALAVSAIISTLFFGGWGTAPILDKLPPWLWFIAKIYFFFAILVWMRGTLPRLRIDQLMGFAWKFLLPLALINLFVTGAEVLVWEEYDLAAGWIIPSMVIINFALAGILIVAWTKLFQLRRAWA